jgi:hypothetical protein
MIPVALAIWDSPLSNSVLRYFKEVPTVQAVQAVQFVSGNSNDLN